MPDLILRTFQPLERVSHLRDDGILLADWKHVIPGTEHAYLRIVEVMEERGIRTESRPPLWAWYGVVRLVDADLLFDATHELSRGFATITFRAPEHLVLLSDDGHWCDVLLSDESSLHQWRLQPRASSSYHPEQACLPYLDLRWGDRRRTSSHLGLGHTRPRDGAVAQACCVLPPAARASSHKIYLERRSLGRLAGSSRDRKGSLASVPRGLRAPHDDGSACSARRSPSATPQDLTGDTKRSQNAATYRCESHGTATIRRTP